VIEQSAIMCVNLFMRFRVLREIERELRLKQISLLIVIECNLFTKHYRVYIHRELTPITN